MKNLITENQIFIIEVDQGNHENYDSDNETKTRRYV